jgi:hypothetical protein
MLATLSLSATTIGLFATIIGMVILAVLVGYALGLGN